jgi:hypothetical protein
MEQRAQEQAEAAADAAHIERLAAQRLLADLRFVTDTGTTTTNTTNSSTSNNSVNNSVNGQHSADVARRVTSLSEQLRAAQLSALEAQRATAALKRERRHLEAALAAKDEDIRALEDAHSAVQTRAVLSNNGHSAAASGSGRSSGGGVSIDMVMLSPREERYAGYSSATAAGRGVDATAGAGAGASGAMNSARSELTAEERALLSEAMAPQQFDFGGLDPEQVLLIALLVYYISKLQSVDAVCAAVRVLILCTH